ncbi:MAG: hypothetical protein MJZ60_08470 [Bacteroidaceae bacterium]|nr:hypothetical protein [Bacteroidaceae bacterium]
MGFFSKLFGKKKAENEIRVGGMEDFMSLIRVYYQSVMAAQLGINNLGALPDLRMFKQSFHVPTLNNKLGLGEKKHCQKLIMDMYGIPETFFGEIDASIKKRCKKVQDVQPYFMMFQGFSQDLMMLMGNLMKWKFRLPGLFKKAMRGMVEKQVHQIMTRPVWKDEGVRRTCVSIRQYQQQLGYSENWMSEYVYTIVMLAKKEPKASVEA